MRLFRPLILLAILAALVGRPLALAQGSTPPPHDPLEHDSAPAQPASPAGQPDAPDAPALGHPGLSFAYQRTFGTTGVPYFVDLEHLNTPAGLFVDGAGSVYVIENEGSRLLRFAADGANSLHVGQAGVHIVGEDTFAWPEDTALDLDGNLWVVDENRAVQLDPSGGYLQAIPADGVGCRLDNDHFCHPGGIAFDPGGRMFVADTGFHRIQIFTFSAGVPRYQATIGRANRPDSDNRSFNSPTRLAVDSSGRLFVADTGNHRIMMCVESDAWSCTPFHGTGRAGSQADRLNAPRGVAVDAAGSVYIADSDNVRLKQCTPAGECRVLPLEFFFWRPTDVAVNAAGEIFVADYDLSVVEKFSPAGGRLGGDFAGRQAVPYLPGADRLHAPNGLAAGAAGLYVTEERGNRLLKLDDNGRILWAVGEPGLGFEDETHFGSSLRGSLALDAAGQIYIPDSDRHRVQIFTPGGIYTATIGMAYQPGGDAFHFRNPNGVAISPVNGDIFVADRDNHRIQVFSAGLNYKASLGTVGLPGSGNDQFDQPSGVAADRAGNLYVADRGNQRVQKFNSKLEYAATLGVAGQPGSDYGHFNNPQSVAVDGQNRVFVADTYNHRILVFDANGAFLAVIGQSWGDGSAQLRSPAGVSVDPHGCVYAADRDNHRVQKFCPSDVRWAARSLAGFGSAANRAVSALESFAGRLYAGTYNSGGAQLHRAASGAAWSMVMSGGFGDAGNTAIADLAAFNGYLYAAVTHTAPPAGPGQQGGIFRSADGLTWSPATQAGLDERRIEAVTLEVFEGALYAATRSEVAGQGAEVWRTAAGAPGSWTRTASNGFGDPGNQAVASLGQHLGWLYAGTANPAGAEIWRSNDGLSWTLSQDGGFGDPDSQYVPDLESFDGWLYAGLYNFDGSLNPGGELWRCRDCAGGDWETPPNLKGFGDSNNRAPAALAVYRGRLYASTLNLAAGVEIWSSADGLAWRQENVGGFGSAANHGPYTGASLAIFQDALYLGLSNPNTGGQVWAFNPFTWLLPVIYR